MHRLRSKRSMLHAKLMTWQLVIIQEGTRRLCLIACIR